MVKFVNGWLFANRFLNSGKIVPCAIPLDAIVEIVEYNNDRTTLVMDYDGQMVEIDAHIIDVLGTLQKYLLSN